MREREPAYDPAMDWRCPTCDHEGYCTGDCSCSPCCCEIAAMDEDGVLCEGCGLAEWHDDSEPLCVGCAA